MSWFQFFILLSLVWWVVFFCLLPVGVKNPHEAGEALVEGQEHGAPVKSNMKKKTLWTTIIAVVLTLITKVTMDYFDFVIPM